MAEKLDIYDLQAPVPPRPPPVPGRTRKVLLLIAGLLLCLGGVGIWVWLHDDAAPRGTSNGSASRAERFRLDPGLGLTRKTLPDSPE